MNPLVLKELVRHPYYASVVCAYVCYRKNEDYVDHTGKKIAELKGYPAKFQEHLTEHVLEKLQAGFKKTLYAPTEVEVLDEETLPCILIRRRDHRPIAGAELGKISAHFGLLLAKLNPSPQLGLFKKEPDSAVSVKEKTADVKLSN